MISLTINKGVFIDRWSWIQTLVPSIHQVKLNLTIRENLILQLIQEFWVEEKGHLINMTALAAKASVTIWTVGNSVFISNFIVDRKTHVGLVHVCIVCTPDYKSRRESRIFQEWNVNFYLTIISKYLKDNLNNFIIILKYTKSQCN